MRLLDNVKGNACNALEAVYDNLGCNNVTPRAQPSNPAPMNPACTALNMVMGTLECDDDSVIN